jgi:hypothetical protein
MFARHPSLRTTAAVETAASRAPRAVALAAAACVLAGTWTLAAAQDTYASSGNTGQWNPQGPLICQVHVDQYNALTPQIDAAARARSTQLKNDLTAQRSLKKADYQACVQNNRPLLKGSASANVPFEGTVHDQYGKALPAMTGTVDYAGVSLTVETAANRRVGEGIGGPVRIVSRPAKFSRAEGYIQSSSTFVITRLWDRSGQSQTPNLQVPIVPKGR